ncbi:ubiquitin recognition factor in ER-associated degradation protein 1 [Lingula anatina]|uniref:Ubiquitin recognition factor in ER-associated degradation protein 1 n=1 Tax=Lingula anatina TaxID=7574 RepID=A0A1S3HBN1_LINAN|nr:ubiquitin recognition factor in ER-associated degradation protein 1 [Lingula anatina]|eukprot:XP_013383423.1 ubiquitin recognition factor in ER-associated degradation protein 1 [Lingula anatina]
MFGFGRMFPELPGNFKTTYRCFSVVMISGNYREDVERGGKIIMPPSALDTLTRLNIQYPMLFKLVNKKTNRETHCGVLEFVADEGRIYLPGWMMKNLCLEEGGLIHLENVSLPVATFAKFQPQSVEFLDITNPKAVLENALRNFACLTTGDVVAISYNEKVYELCVLETKPGKATSIIECDMNVEFAPPIGYQEPTVPHSREEHEQEEDTPMDTADYVDQNLFRAFSGQGERLDGKKKGTESSPSKLEPHEIKRGIPNYDYQKGKITFIRRSRPKANGTVEKENLFEAFSGEGQALRKNRKR